jgi:hypothetical protein
MNPAITRILSEMRRADHNLRDSANTIEAEFNRLDAESVTASTNLANLQTDHARALAAERTKERERIRAITTHPEAANRKTQAENLALETDLSVEVAATVLKASPTERTNRIPTIEERAEGLAEFGTAHGAGAFGAKADPWAKIVDKTNKGR